MKLSNQGHNVTGGTGHDLVATGAMETKEKAEYKKAMLYRQQKTYFNATELEDIGWNQVVLDQEVGDDRQRDGHGAGGMQRRSRNMEDLREPYVLHMRHHRQGRIGSDDTHRERTNRQVYRHAEDRVKLGRPQREAADWQDLTFSDEQQGREIEAAEIRCEQTDCRRSEGGHFGTATFR
eukprot:16452017-Heterocapsa_arctica.AAC.1